MWPVKCQYVIFLSFFSLYFILNACQTTQSHTNTVATAQPILIDAPATNLESLTPEQRQDLRVWLDTFYDGTPRQWELARNNILKLGDAGTEALSIFCVKFFFGGKQNIPIRARSEDIAEYWDLARRELVLLNDKAVPYIVAAMAHPKMGTTGRMQCSLTLVQIGKPAVPTLVANLERGNRGFQRMVLETLAKIEDPKSAGPIGDFYKKTPMPAYPSDDINQDPTADVRYYAIKALGKLQAVEGLPALTLALNDTNPLVVEQALKALLQFGDPVALPALQKALDACQGEFLGYRRRIEQRIELLSLRS